MVGERARDDRSRTRFNLLKAVFMFLMDLKGTLPDLIRRVFDNVCANLYVSGGRIRAVPVR